MSSNHQQISVIDTGGADVYQDLKMQIWHQRRSITQGQKAPSRDQDSYHCRTSKLLPHFWKSQDLSQLPPRLTASGNLVILLLSTSVLAT